jgi:hypothetical protein
MLLLATFVLGAESPSTQPAKQIQKWFEELADTDPVVREKARFELMGLKRDELNALRKIISASTPLAPAQSSVLRDIVIHVYLANSNYQAHEKRGFLGAYLTDLMPVDANPDEALEERDNSTVVGVMIREPMQGFCAYRYLRAGDVVLGVIGSDYYPTQMLTDLQTRVAETLPGDKITLLLLRDGKKMRVSIAVDAQPVAAVQAAMDQFRNLRAESAEQYWKMTFAPLLERNDDEMSKAGVSNPLPLPIGSQASKIRWTHGFPRAVS